MLKKIVRKLNRKHSEQDIIRMTRPENNTARVLSKNYLSKKNLSIDFHFCT